MLILEPGLRAEAQKNPKCHWKVGPVRTLDSYFQLRKQRKKENPDCTDHDSTAYKDNVTNLSQFAAVTSVSLISVSWS